MKPWPKDDPERVQRFMEKAGRAEEILRRARERREEEVRAELREKIAASLEAEAEVTSKTLLRMWRRDCAARIREGALG